MSGLAIKDITKRFGDFTAVDAINLGVPHGTFVCLLGPSGCGKTTLLRMIAGLEEPTSGAIMLDDQDITPMPTHKRNLGMVFQSLALFPHLSVGDNIAYALRIRPPGRQAFGRAAAACRDRQGAGALAKAVPARRAAVGARRQVARGHAGGVASIAAAARHHHDRRHP